MNSFENKDVVQAILIADNNVRNFKPFSNTQAVSLIPLVNVPLIDYALESLNRSGMEEVYVISTLFVNDIRNHIKKQIENCCSWSVKMKVTVIGSEGCRCLGDVLRDLDAKGLIRGHFIMMGADTITNANLTPILEQHKKKSKFDKGTALTVVYKESTNNIRTGDEIMIAKDSQNHRLHFHQRIKSNNTVENNFKIPLEIFLNNSQIILHHNLIDPQIAICSPSLLSLFSDNFDFENRDDFIKGLLINEEILDSRIYVTLLPKEQYARKVSNWLTYQITSNDIINRWVYPLVPDMGICCLKQIYIFLRNNIYKHPNSNMNRVMLKENIVIGDSTIIDSGTIINGTVIGTNCIIGKNCILKTTFIGDHVVIEDNCILEFCIIGNFTKIGNNSKLMNGVIIGEQTIIPNDTNITNVIVEKQSTELNDNNCKQLGSQAFIIDDNEEIYQADSDDDDLEPIQIKIPKMMKIPVFSNVNDDYSSTEDEDSIPGSPIPDDTNIFLSEVIDSLNRGFMEKSNPDFLILEINSSRYAYNMTLQEVNFYVVKAILSLPHIKNSNSSNILTSISQVFHYLGPVVLNYIKTTTAMLDCLKAVEECFNEENYFRAKAAKIIHYLYDKEYITEDAIISWHKNLDDESEWLIPALNKLIEWLQQTSEEDSSNED